MSSRVRAHIRQNVVGYIALACFVVGGTAIASAPRNTVTSRSIKNHGVKKVDLHANSVDATKVVNGSLGSPDVGNGSLTGADLGAGSVSESQLADGSVTGSKLAPGAVTGVSIQDKSITADDIDQSTLRGQILGGEWTNLGMGNGARSRSPEGLDPTGGPAATSWLMPVEVTVSNLHASTTTAPSTEFSRTVSMLGFDPGFNFVGRIDCLIADTATTCSAPGSFTIPAGGYLRGEEKYIDPDASNRINFGYLLRFADP